MEALSGNMDIFKDQPKPSYEYVVWLRLILFIVVFVGLITVSIIE